uniref:Uncharacterized protein n=1 Tax=Solanum lycopersicum TaxID=4081 RepID=A0A3Q7HPU3_SOLLC
MASNCAYLVVSLGSIQKSLIYIMHNRGHYQVHITHSGDQNITYSNLYDGDFPKRYTSYVTTRNTVKGTVVVVLHGESHRLRHCRKRGQKGNYDNKKSNLVRRYYKKTGHSIQNSVKSNVVTSIELSGDFFMTGAESKEHEKLLTQGPSMKSPMLLGES